MKRTINASCAVLALATSGAFAQDATPLVLDIVTVAAESETPGEVEISPAELERRAPTNLQEVFAGETAITVGNAIAPVQKTYVHGIEDAQLSFSVDGVRQPHGAFHHAGNVLLDPGLLKAVEIRPGVAAADDGPQAVAGTIKFETMDARDLLEPGRSFGGFTGLRWDSNGNTFRESGAIYGRTGGFEAMLYGTNVHGDDFEDGGGSEVLGTEADLYNLLGKVAYTANSGYRLEFSADHVNDDGDRQFRANFGGLVGSDTPLMGYDFERTTVALSLRDETPDGWFAPDIQMSYNDTSVDITDKFNSGLPTRYGGFETFQGKFANDFTVPLGVITAGIDFQIDEAEGGVDGDRLTENSEQVGLFAQARIEPADRLFLSFGARADYQWFEGLDGTEFNDGGFSGNIAADYALTDWLTLNAGYSHVWGGYKLGEAAIFTSAWNYDDFDTSSADNFRVGFDVEHGGFFGSAGLFYTKIHDAPDIQVADRGTAADLRSQGVDASIGYRTPRLLAKLNYTYADVDLDGNPVQSTFGDYRGQAFGHLFGIEANYEVLEGLKVGGDAQIALKNDETDGLPAARGTTHKALPAYEVVNLYAEYEPPQVSGLSLRLGISNVFDEEYQIRPSNGAGQDDLIVPLNEPGRSFFIAAKYKF